MRGRISLAVIMLVTSIALLFNGAWAVGCCDIINTNGTDPCPGMGYTSCDTSTCMCFGAPGASGYCGDAVCQPTETSSSCFSDCPGGNNISLSSCSSVGGICCSSSQSCSGSWNSQVSDCSSLCCIGGCLGSSNATSRTCFEAGGTCCTSSQSCTGFFDYVGITDCPSSCCKQGICQTGGATQTCSQKGGIICSIGQSCNGNITVSSDNSNCCIGTCQTVTCTNCTPSCSSGYFCDFNTCTCKQAGAGLSNCSEGIVPSSGCLCGGISSFSGYCCSSVYKNSACGMTCSSSEISCSDAVDNDCDGWLDGADPDCAGSSSCDNDYICDSGEYSSTCADCCANNCGDGFCSGICNETYSTCPSDCGGDPCPNDACVGYCCTTGFCGDYVCDPSMQENSTNCPVDCGTSSCKTGCCAPGVSSWDYCNPQKSGNYVCNFQTGACELKTVACTAANKWACTTKTDCESSSANGLWCNSMCNDKAYCSYCCNSNSNGTGGYCQSFTCGSGVSCSSVSQCFGGDGCCPSGCTGCNDFDCGPCSAGCQTDADCSSMNCFPFCASGKSVCVNGACKDCRSNSECSSTYPVCASDKICVPQSYQNFNCSAVTWCAAGDSCCPSGCNSQTDGDCVPTEGCNITNGFKDCSGDGTCENLWMDKKNCGSCGNTCASGCCYYNGCSAQSCCCNSGASTCSPSTLSGCFSSTECNAVGGFWCGSWCQSSACPSCSSTNIWACSTETACKGAGANWCGTWCDTKLCPVCSSYQLSNCFSSSSCTSAGGSWCSDSSSSGGWCQFGSCPVCSSSSPWNCRTESECAGAGAKWCNGYCDYQCMTCSKETPWHCSSQSNCTSAGGNWCSTFCSDMPCQKCSKENIGACNIQTDCITAGGKWCNDSWGSWCDSYKCPVCSSSELWGCSSKESCEAVNGFWMFDHCESSATKEFKTCSSNSTWNCFDKPTCEGAGGYWCGSLCQSNPCATCSAVESWNCYTQENCKNAGANWCGTWCQNEACPKCSSSQVWNCFTSQECVNTGGKWCTDNYGGWCTDNECPKCSSSQVFNCYTKSECELSGGKWCKDNYGSWCQNTQCPSCDVYQLWNCFTKETCEAKNGYWCGTACQSSPCPTCRKGELWNCYTQESCLSVEGYWCTESDFSGKTWGHCSEIKCPVCSAGEPWNCKSSVKCSDAGGNWCNNVCQKTVCSNVTGYCGDFKCDSWESSNNCPIDCKSSSFEMCSDGKDNDGDSLTDCFDSECACGGNMKCVKDSYGDFSFCKGDCSKIAPGNCMNKTECNAVGGFWCGMYCNNYQCPECSSVSKWNCYTQSDCKSAGGTWCNNTMGYGFCQEGTCPSCSANEFWNCFSSTECTTAGGFWCRDHCDKLACETCSKDSVWNCFSSTECKNAGGYWCGDRCDVAQCPECSSSQVWNCKKESTCTTAGGFWCGSWCQNVACATCSYETLWNCYDQSDCTKKGGNWCNNFCQKEACPKCSSSQSWACASKASCESVQANWCSDNYGSWCQNMPCPSCSKESAWFCYSKEKCESAGAKWCSSGNQSYCDPYNCKVCSIETAWDCYTENDCKSAGANWCGSYCSKDACPSCSAETPWNCFVKSDCSNVGGSWCENNPAPMSSVTGMFTASSGYCSDYCPSCLQQTPWNCFTKETCESNNGKWCGSWCTEFDCPKCGFKNPWDCYTKEACENAGASWCNGFCQNFNCNGGKGICDYHENCQTSEDCICPAGSKCEPSNREASFMGCIVMTSKECGNGICESGEECKNCAKDCVCKEGYSCNPGSGKANIIGCVFDKKFTVTADGLCSSAEDCSSSPDCECTANSFCSGTPNGFRCVKQDGICGDGFCDRFENCNSCKKDCSCPLGMECKNESANYFCSFNEGYETKCGNGICEPGENCQKCVDCACPKIDGFKCSPSDEFADMFGCIMTKNFAGNKTGSLCGDKICDAGECETCPYDCSSDVCASDGKCSVQFGENCALSSDCKCSEDNVCNVTSPYANRKGCVAKFFCGDGTCENGELCCVDCGCGIAGGECLPSFGKLGDEGLQMMSELFNINEAELNRLVNELASPSSFTCRKGDYCGDGECSEDENCCLDCGCQEGDCIAVNPTSFECISGEDTCGDGTIQPYETSFTCCSDAGCPNGLTCEDNKCVTELFDFDSMNLNETQLKCVNDSDCVSFGGCGCLPKAVAGLNPQCPDIKTAVMEGKAECSCNDEGSCYGRMVSENANSNFAYKARVDEALMRLANLKSDLLNQTEAAKAVAQFFLDRNELEKATGWINATKDMISLINEVSQLNADISAVRDNPTEKNINFIQNEIDSMIDRVAGVLESIVESLKLLEGGEVQ